MALARAIAGGADVNGDGSNDLRTTGIGYYARASAASTGRWSWPPTPPSGSACSTCPAGPSSHRPPPRLPRRRGPGAGHRRPALLNGGDAGFTESGRSPRPAGTSPWRRVAIQNVGARTNWIDRSGSPEAFAPPAHPPGGGDAGEEGHLPVRLRRRHGAQPHERHGHAGWRPPRRDDLLPQRPRGHALEDPHGFLLDPRIEGRQQGQFQVPSSSPRAASITDPDGPAPVFEVPITNPATLERCNFSQAPATGEPPAESPGAAIGSCTWTVMRVTACGPLAGLREREDVRAGARARGSRFSFLPRGRWRDRRGLPGLGPGGASSATGGSRASRGGGARSPGAGRGAPATGSCSPASASAWRRASATSGASRCAAATAASGSGARSTGAAAAAC